MVGSTMSRVIAAVACGLTLAACSMSMPSLDFFKSSPATEQLRIESEPPGADARTSQGQTCRTPCELTVPSGGELAVTVAMNGYQPQTLPVRPEASDGGSGKLQPNPVYVELQAVAPVKPGKKAPAKKRTSAVAKPPAAPGETQAATPASASSSSNSSYPASSQGYPWPPAPQ
jgi:hypothetical protein